MARGKRYQEASKLVDRTKTYEAIIKGKDIPEPGIPESFRVLKHELQALAIDVKMLDENGHEVSLEKSAEDEAVTPIIKEEIEVEDEDVTSIVEDDEIVEAAVAGFDDLDMQY